MKTVKTSMKGIQLSIDKILSIKRYNSYEDLGKALVQVAEYIKYGEEPEFNSEEEAIIFEDLVEEPIAKAKAWERQTANFRNNNPRKSIGKTIQPNEEFDKETGEIIETENKAQEEPIKEENDKDIIPAVKVPEIAQNEAIMPNVKIRAEKMIQSINNNPINTDNKMYTEDGKIWHKDEEIKTVAREIWETYSMDANTDFDNFKREILPQYTQGWANVDRTRLKDVIGLTIHQLKERTA